MCRPVRCWLACGSRCGLWAQWPVRRSRRRAWPLWPRRSSRQGWARLGQRGRWGGRCVGGGAMSWWGSPCWGRHVVSTSGAPPPSPPLPSPPLPPCVLMTLHRAPRPACCSEGTRSLPCWVCIAADPLALPGPPWRRRHRAHPGLAACRRPYRAYPRQACHVAGATEPPAPGLPCRSPSGPGRAEPLLSSPAPRQRRPPIPSASAPSGDDAGPGRPSRPL